MKVTGNRILSAPKKEYIAALRDKAISEEKGGKPLKGQLDVFEPHETPPNHHYAKILRKRQQFLRMPQERLRKKSMTSLRLA